MGNSISGQDTLLESYQPITMTLAVNLGSATVQNVIDVTETGVLCSVALGPLDSLIATLAATLEIQVDGQTTQSFTLYTAGTLNASLICFATFIDALSNMNILLPYGTRYLSSCRVGVNVSNLATGTVYLGVTRARKY